MPSSGLSASSRRSTRPDLRGPTGGPEEGSMTTPDRNTSTRSPAVSRRTFLAGSAAVGATAAAGLEGILAARRAPAFAQGTRLNIVRWVDFIPACDVELKRQAVDASKALGAEVVFEFINANDLQARITAAMQSGAGPDIIQMLQVTTKLKKKGKPYGQTLGHTFGDAPGWAYPLMWNYGGMEVDKSGKTAIDSQGSVDAVKFMTAFWKDSCDEGGLAWDDTNNNRAFLAGEICATLNGASIYIAAKRGQDKIKDEKGEPMVRDIQHARLPAGPAASSSYQASFHHGVMKYGKNQKLAKDFLPWLHGKEQFGKWFQVAEGFSIGSTKFWEQHPLWTTIDEPMKGFRTAADNSRVFGYAGAPSAKATEAYSKYVVVDMFAKGVQGMKPEDAVAWAAEELKKIYG